MVLNQPVPASGRARPAIAAVLLFYGLLTGLFTHELRAQISSCQEGRAPLGDLGYSRLVCDCTVSSGSRDSAPTGRFRSTPRIYGIRSQGPGAGKLREGDEILEIDGVAITTQEGGRRFARITSGVRVILTIRRGERTRQVAITPAPLCPEDPRAFGRLAPELPGELSSNASPPLAGSSRSRGQTPAPSARQGPPSRTPGIVPRSPATPAGWFGFALACHGCGWSLSGNAPTPVWESSEPPEVAAVDPDGPARRAGIEVGDRIERVDGLSLLSPDGAQRLGAVQPGGRIRLTLRRGSRLIDTDLVVGTYPTGAPASPVPDTDSDQRLRYTGRAGNSLVDVWSAASVTVTVAPNGDLIVKTGDATIRVRSSTPVATPEDPKQ